MVEILDPMEHEAHEAEHAITFHVNLKTPGELDQLAFIHYVEQKFDATVHAIERFWKSPTKPCGSVELHFPDADSFEEAKHFCEEKLTSTGLTIASFREEVEHADFSGAGAEHLLREIYAAPVPEPKPEEEWQD